MPRYVNQSSLNACGPIAVINASKWAGMNLSIKKDFDMIATLCDYEELVGSTWQGINRAIRAIMPKYVRVRQPSWVGMFDIDYQLRFGGACLISILDSKDAHIFLISEKRRTMYVSHNYNMHRPTTLLRDTTIIDNLLHGQCWMLNKEN